MNIPLAGDIVKKVTETLGIHTCSECEKRRKMMNDADRKLRESLGIVSEQKEDDSEVKD